MNILRSISRLVRSNRGASSNVLTLFTVNAPFVYGPLADGIKVAKGIVLSLSTISTLGNFYHSILPEAGRRTKLANPQALKPWCVDVRDLAKAHILALSAPSEKEIGRKRLLVAGPNFTWRAAVEHLLATRPELKDRLPDPRTGQSDAGVCFDVQKARAVLGLATYIDWRETVSNSVDSLLKVEESWKRD